jgi:hypothetical protein
MTGSKAMIERRRIQARAPPIGRSRWQSLGNYLNQPALGI